MKQSISSLVSTTVSSPISSSPSSFNRTNCLIHRNQVDHLYQPNDSQYASQGDPKQESSFILLSDTKAHQIVEPQPVASQGNGWKAIESSDSNSVKAKVSRASSSPLSSTSLSTSKSPTTVSSSSGRRSRTNFTSNQIATMESVFYNSTHYPDVKCLTELSMKLGLPETELINGSFTMYHYTLLLFIKLLIVSTIIVITRSEKKKEKRKREKLKIDFDVD